MQTKLGLSAKLARASARRPWRTLGIWLVLFLLIGVLAGAAGNKFSDNFAFTNNPGSQQGDQLIKQHLEKNEVASETIVITSPTYTVDDPAFRSVVEKTMANVQGLTGFVATTQNYYELSAKGDPMALQLVSKDRHTTIIPVSMTKPYENLKDEATKYMDTALKERGNGINVYTAGDLSGNEVFNQIANQDLGKDIQIGLPMAIIVLIFVFGALVAAGVPIILGLISIATATSIVGIVSHFVDLNNQVTIMVSMIGLAVGIDYALFVIERYREERRHGYSRDDAIVIAGGTAGTAVLFSGMTVILAMLGMFMIPVNIFRGLGLGAIVVVMIAVAATQTLLPAIIRLLGNKLEFPRRPRYDAAAIAKQARYDAETIHKGFWGRITRTVMNNAGRVFVVCVAFLILLALPVLDLKTGNSGVDSLPKTDVTTAMQILLRDFYGGSASPVRIVVDGQSNSPEVQSGVNNLVAALKSDSRFGPPSIIHSQAGDLTVVDVQLSIDPDSRQAYSTIDHLRDTTIPQAFGNQASHIFVTGDTASVVDVNAALSGNMPRVFAFVLGLSFLLLLLAFRSVVIPLTAIFMNLLSVGAAYGVLVAVFQKGIGAGLLGVHQVEVITTWIPLLLFCILFGLSMDYHVFLLSRIREHYDQTGRTDESIAAGLQSTGKIITGAAFIMASIFAAFATGRLVEIQELGLGLAVAILLDATVVRSLLVPATMKLLGRANWYLPWVLRWLPDLRIDNATAPTPARREHVGSIAD